MAHPTEAELRSLGQEILDLLVEKTIEEADSFNRSIENQRREDPGYEPAAGPQSLMREVEAYIRETYSFLPDTFARFAEPRPESFDDAVEQCVAAAMVIQPGLENLEQAAPGNVQQEGEVWPNPSFALDAAARYPTTAAERMSAVTSQVEDWAGDAADAFHLHYLNEFPDALRYQHAAVATLAVTLEANKRIFECVGNDILEIGAQTKEALRHVTDKDPAGFVVAFTVVSAVATVASAGAATPAIAAAWATVAAMGTGAATFFSLRPHEHKPEIEGATTQEVMASMMEQITELYQCIWEEEAKIVGCLEAVQGFFDNADVREEIEMPLPDSYTNLDTSSHDDLKEEFMYPG